MHLLSALAAVALAATAACSSLERSPLRALARLDDPTINSASEKGRRLTALSRFSLDFDVADTRHFRLNLEPNPDVIQDGATVSYLGADGHIRHTEPLNPLDHKVYKGLAWELSEDGEYEQVGWARISVLRDGKHPLFEGAFSVHNDDHHILLTSSYLRTRRPLDPEIDLEDDEYMVVFRDSDMVDNRQHSELRRREEGLACLSDTLDFNNDPNHPVLAGLRKRDENLAGMSFNSLFGKRQIDKQGSGNTAGVNLLSTIGNPAGCPTTRKVALVGIATDCNFRAQFNSTASTKAFVIATMNSASSVWESTFNISLGIQNLTISELECPGAPQAATPWNQACSTNIDITQRLNLFSGWRGSLNDHNSHWTLFTNCKTGEAIGLAWLGQACVHNPINSNSTGDGTVETVAGANVVSLVGTEWQVVAHETGHTFGAVHDCDTQTCADSSYVNSQQCCQLSTDTCSADSQYIMNPYTSSVTKFSACTLGNICSAIGRNSVNTTCLVDNKGVILTTGQTCGNGIVEEGEECDCGGTAGCGDDPCCDPTTCKFVNGAVCDDANEDCCTGCQFASKGRVCRPSTGMCDPQEVCSGASADCPTDKTLPDGTACTSSNSTDTGLQCASGQCTSRDLQCQTVMSAYTHGNNDTYACDDITCTMSCASPAFPPNTCYSLQQNLLDGTACGGGGSCMNGQCVGSSFGKEIADWIDQHKDIVIGIAVAVGVLLLLCVLGCISNCCRRRRLNKNAPKQMPPNPGMTNYIPPDSGWYAPSPGHLQYAPPRGQPQGSWIPAPPPVPQRETDTYAPPPGPPPGYPRAQSPPVSPVHSPVSPVSAPTSPWRPPTRPAPSQPPQGLSGNGILGGRQWRGPMWDAGGGSGGGLQRGESMRYA